MENLIFFRLVTFIVKFLSELTEGKIHKKEERYYIPINFICRSIDCSIEEIENIISQKEIGLERVKYPKKVEKIKDFLLEYDSNFRDKNEYGSEFKTALELMTNNDSAEPYPNFKNTDQHLGKKKNLSTEIFKGRLSESDFSNGLLHIKSIPLFAEVSSKYEDWEKILRIFDWKKFEDFISVILLNFGYHTITNFRFSLNKKNGKKSTVVSKTTKKLQKRFEVDVLAIKENEILFIDAKYWKLNSDHGSSLSAAGIFQSERAKLFCQDKEAILKFFENFDTNFQNKQIRKIHKKNKDSDAGISNFWVYPIIMYAGISEKKINFTGVPIVSINEFSDFIHNFHANKYSFIRYKIKKLEFQSRLN